MSNSDEIENSDVLPAPLMDESGICRITYTPSDFKIIISLLKSTIVLLLFSGYVAFIICVELLTGHAMSPPMLLVIVACILFIYSFFAVIQFSNNRDFILRQSGLTLPLIYLLPAKGRLNWNWSQLVGLKFSRSSKYSLVPDQLVLEFEYSVSKFVNIHVKFNEIQQLDLKKLVYSVVTNAPHVLINPPLEEVVLEFPTVSGIKHINFDNFTSLWNEEFSTRYSPTLFVPLAQGHELRNKSIVIQELVACGGSAAIYSAKDISGNMIIVKEAVIPKNASDELRSKAIELFNREALILGKLDHPNIAKVLDHFVENEHHYEVLEFIDGLDLRRFVKERGPQPEDFVLNWAEQICEILVYLHTQVPPVIHRDITPDNLVLKVDGQLVLIDFGAANAFVGIATGTMVGKQSYMPPEQLRGQSVPQSDIYSLGGTCFYLLTGKEPIPLEVSQIGDNAEFGQSLNPFLAKCTAFELDDRYKNAHEVLDDIRRIRQERLIESVANPVRFKE